MDNSKKEPRRFITKLKLKQNSSNRVLKLSCLVLLTLSQLNPIHAQEGVSEAKNETEETGKGEVATGKNTQGTPVVFETQEGISKMRPSGIISGTFYYSNANNDPAVIPSVGEEDGIKYIRISSIGGNPSKMSETVSKLDRWVRIPEKRPSAIAIEFKTKVTKNDDFEWLTATGSKQPERRIGFIVNFLRDDGVHGGGTRISPKEFNTIDQWQTHSYTIPIPANTKYLHIGMETSGGYSLWLGDWKIK
jgi:hypothetical protein